MAHSGQLPGAQYVEKDGEQQPDSGYPEKGAVGQRRGADLPQPLGVVVEFFGPEIELEVAEHVPDDKTEERDPGERHHRFLA